MHIPRLSNNTTFYNKNSRRYFTAALCITNSKNATYATSATVKVLPPTNTKSSF